MSLFKTMTRVHPHPTGGTTGSLSLDVTISKLFHYPPSGTMVGLSKDMRSRVPHPIREAWYDLRINRDLDIASLPISETKGPLSLDSSPSVSPPAGSMVKAVDPALFP
jgi:hypothetical protein